MHRYGGLPAWLAALAVLALAAFLSLYLAAAMAAVARWRPRSRGGAALLFAAPGCSPSWRAASSSPAFRGSRAATRRSTRRSPGWRRGSASTASARSPPGWPRRSASAPLRRARALARAGRRARRRPGRRRARSAASTTRRRRGALTRLAAAGQRAAGREVRAAAPAPRRWPGDRGAARGGARRSGGRPGDRRSRCCPSSSTDGYWTALLRALPRAGPGRAARHAAGRPEHGYTNSAVGISARRRRCRAASTATTSTTWCRSASSSRPAFAGSRDLMNIPLGDFNRGPRDGAVVRRRRRARRAQHLLRRPVRRGAGGALRADAASAPTILANISNIGWFGEHHRHRPAPAASRACARSSCSGR